MTDLELGVMEHPCAQLIHSDQDGIEDFIEEKITSRNGSRIHVYVVGDHKKQAMLTFHDLGLNANSCFQSFFQFSEMATISDRFCIYHINAPGQEEDAEPFPENYVYPSMDELADMVGDVVSHFGLKSFIGFGVGAGANVLCRYALKNPRVVDALILVNCSAAISGWIEWGYQKANIYYLRNRGMTSFTVDYLMWHHFGRNLDQYNYDLINSYRQYFSHLPNPKNLAGFIESYISRTDLGIKREGPTLQCAVLQIVGAGSPHVNDSVDLNGRLNPSNSNWLKISESSGLVLEEKPEKITEAVLLFLQGQGHLPSISHLKWRKESRAYSLSASSRSRSLQLHPSIQEPVAIALEHVQEEGVPVRGLRSHSIANPEFHMTRRAVSHVDDRKFLLAEEPNEISTPTVSMAPIKNEMDVEVSMMKREGATQA